MGLLIGLSQPYYTDHLSHQRRLDAVGELAKLALAMEQFRMQHDSYRHASLTKLGFSSRIVKGHYRLAIKSADDNDFLLTADAIDQKDRQSCGTLTMTANGIKRASGSESVEACWR